MKERNDKVNYYEITIKTTSEATEAISNILYEIGVNGVSIEDPQELTNLENNDEKNWDYVDGELFDYEGVIIKGYIPFGEDIKSKEKYLINKVDELVKFGIDTGDKIIEINEVKDDNWANSWKQYYKPVHVTDDFVIKPSWEEYEAKANEQVLIMDPGGAFGSGTHETTKLCIKKIQQYLKKDDVVFDVGCGSGILGISALLMGASRAVFVDIDEAAVSATKENTQLNNVYEKAEIIKGNLLDKIDYEADVIVANIIADIIIMLASYIGKFMKPDTPFISSGIILDRVDDVTKALVENGMEVIEVEKDGEWAVVVSRKA
jgi:ribosomal protein L11 methyltransferase